MDDIVKKYFVEIYQRPPTPEEWVLFRAGFWAGSEFEAENLWQEDADRDTLDTLEGLI